MKKKKIIIQTNSPSVKTGLAENGRALAKYLHKTGKYDIIYYCTQMSAGDPVLQMMPWKAYGAIPMENHIIQQLNANPGLARDVCYGSHYIDEIIRNEKPDAIVFSDDIWAVNLDHYANKKWHSKVNPVYHITVDSVPILDQAYQQAHKTAYYFTWAKFAEKEMKRTDPLCKHVGTIYGAVNVGDFVPLTDESRKELRRRMGINEKTTIIGMVGRNQLRKSKSQMLVAFAEYKRENPGVDIKLHFHTSFSEKGSGWDIEKLIKYYGINPNDILCTYICRQCGDWTVEPYRGEDIDCAKCGAQKSRITCNIANGVPNEEMKLVYGLWDAGINAHTSAGLEFNCINTLLCGLPLAVTNYASGEDFAEQPFVTALNFERTFEAGTSFVKAATSIKSIKGYYDKVVRMTPEKRREIGMQGYAWASKTFSIETIGPQWEALFDSMPYVDWTDFSFDAEPKNPNYTLPADYLTMDEDAFITLLYKEILRMDESPSGDGFKNWKSQLARGVTRDHIVNYFRNVANDENNKNRKIEFTDLLDKTDIKRGLIMCKESIGDIIMVSSLFESFHEQYPDHRLYVMVDPKYNEVLEGNPYIHRLLPYVPAFEQELLAIGAGSKNGPFDVFLFPTIPSQKILGYLSQSNPATIPNV